MHDPTTIDIQIGSFSGRYELWITDADHGYDGFGTIHLRDLGETTGDSGATYRHARLVLIDQRHVAWQTTRYASGLYPCERIERETDFAVRELVKRLLGEDARA